jgi:cobalt-zinc-cadmium efflux system membrane fusion protein
VEVAQNDGSSAANATIAYVAPAGDAESQSVVARAVLNNNDGRWVVGQFVTGKVVVTQADVPISVVPAAIQSVAGSEVVFIQSAKGFEARQVKIGRRSPQALEILSGIHAGDRYAAANSYLIKAEMIKSEMEVGD